jgi:hypothetical protein
MPRRHQRTVSDLPRCRRGYPEIDGPIALLRGHGERYGKRKAAHPCQGRRLCKIIGVTEITQNQPKAQAPRGKKRPTRFSTLLAKTVEAAFDEGKSFKFEVVPEASPATVIPLEGWKQSREG